MSGMGIFCEDSKDFKLDLDSYIPKFLIDSATKKGIYYLEQAENAYQSKRLFVLISYVTKFSSLTITYGGSFNPEIYQLSYKIWSLLDVSSNTKLNEKTAGFNCLSSLINSMLTFHDQYWMTPDGIKKLAEQLNFIKMSDLLQLFTSFFSRDGFCVPKDGVGARQYYLKSLVKLGGVMRKVWVFDSEQGSMIVQHVQHNISYTDGKFYYYFYLLTILCPSVTLAENLVPSKLLYQWWHSANSKSLNSIVINLLKRATKYHYMMRLNSAKFEEELSNFIPFLYQICLNYMVHNKNNNKDQNEFKEVIPSEYASLSDKSSNLVCAVAKIIVLSQNFQYLNQLISFLEPYSHPCKFGSWSVSISNFFHTLLVTLTKSAIRRGLTCAEGAKEFFSDQNGGESTCLDKNSLDKTSLDKTSLGKFWGGCLSLGSNYLNNLCLGKILNKNCLETIHALAMSAIMSRSVQVSSNYLDVLKRICFLYPQLLTPTLEKLILLMDIQEDPHSSIVSMRALAHLTPLILKQSPDYVPIIISSCMRGIIPSDPMKSSQALFLISLLSSPRALAVNGHMSSAFGKLVVSTNPAEELPFSPLELFYLIIGWGETVQFSNEMSLTDQGVLTIVKSSVISLLRIAVDKDDLNAMAERFLIFNVTQDNVRFASAIALGFALSSPVNAERIFKGLIMRISNFEDDISPQLSLLSSLVRCVPNAYKFSSDVSSILSNCWDSKHKMVFKAAVKLVQRLIETCLTIYPVTRSVENLEWYIPKPEVLGHVLDIVATGLEKSRSALSREDLSPGAENLNDSVNRAYAFLYRILKAGFVLSILELEPFKAPSFSDLLPRYKSLYSSVVETVDALSSKYTWLSSTHSKMTRVFTELATGGAVPVQFGGLNNPDYIYPDSLLNKEKLQTLQYSGFFLLGAQTAFAYNVPYFLLSSELVDPLSLYYKVTRRSHFFDISSDAIFRLIVHRSSLLVNHLKLPVDSCSLKYLESLGRVAVMSDEKSAGKAKCSLMFSIPIVSGSKSKVIKYIFNLVSSGTDSAFNTNYDNMIKNAIKVFTAPLIRRIVSNSELLELLFKFLSDVNSASTSSDNVLLDSTRLSLVGLMERALCERLSYVNSYRKGSTIIDLCMLAWAKKGEADMDILDYFKNSVDLSIKEISQSLLLMHEVHFNDLSLAISNAKILAGRRKKAASTEVGSNNSLNYKLVKALRIDPQWVRSRYSRLGTGISLQSILFFSRIISEENIDEALQALRLLSQNTDEPESNIVFIELLTAVVDKIDVNALSIFVSKAPADCIYDLADSITLSAHMGKSLVLWSKLFEEVFTKSNLESINSLYLYRCLILATALTLNRHKLDFVPNLLDANCLQVREQYSIFVVAYLIIFGTNMEIKEGTSTAYCDGLLKLATRMASARKFNLTDYISLGLQKHVEVAFGALQKGEEELKAVAKKYILSLSQIEFDPICSNSTVLLNEVINSLISWLVKSLEMNFLLLAEVALEGIRQVWIRTQFLQKESLLDKLIPLFPKVSLHLYTHMACLISTMPFVKEDSDFESMHFIQLAGLIYAFPYSMRNWTKNVLVTLAKRVVEGQESGEKKFLQSTIQDFFKTHTDGWNEWKDSFSRDEIDLIELARGRLSYFI